jgi:hypothetical protein
VEIDRKAVANAGFADAESTVTNTPATDVADTVSRKNPKVL